jgi:hemerythrin superfamily protein
MDATKLLTQDHDTVRDLFDQFRTAKDGGDSQRMKAIQREIFGELETHARIEEDVFYPAVRDTGVTDLEEDVDESLQEHHVVKVLMREIEDLSDEDVFIAKMTVLIENVEHHAEEEETEMFPSVREQMSADELDELGRRLEEAKS